MAVLCAPLTTADLLTAEKSRNVFIMRKLEYDSVESNYEKFVSSFRNLPYKLMFVFSKQDAIIVNTEDDHREVIRRLSC